MLAYINAALSGTADPFWPHLVLLSVSTIAGAAVGAGIVFEAPRFSPTVHKIAMWSVIIGVIAESASSIILFTFDEGISGAQQAKIIALETRLAPRTLTDSQQNAIAQAVEKFAGTPCDFSFPMDIEPISFAWHIKEALVKAGWRPQAAIGFTMHWNGPDAEISIGPVPVAIVIASSKQKEWGLPMLALKDALTAAGFEGIVAEAVPDEDSNPAAIHIKVSTK